MNVFAAMNAIEIERKAKFIWSIYQCLTLVSECHAEIPFGELAEYTIETNHHCVPIYLTQIKSKQYIKELTTYELNPSVKQTS